MKLSRQEFIASITAAAAVTAVLGSDSASAEDQMSPILDYPPGMPQVKFAVDEIKRACNSATKTRVPRAIRIVLDAKMGVQGYRIDTLGDGTLRVTGGDATGSMYGGLDVAEAITSGTLAQLGTHNRAPYIANRGIKFNLPLDVRSPSYSDSGDAAWHNIPEMWSISFWHDFLDEMARHRFNVLTLWNLHPFPSMVSVPEYPAVALNDVMRTTKPFTGDLGSTGAHLQMAEECPLEVVKRMTITDKIAFWRDVMLYAHDRGIDVYMFTWNIFVNGTGGKYGLSIAQDNLTTINYFRCSVRELFLTYPLLKGIGITSGEQMQSLPGDFSSERWLRRTYGEGIADVKKQQPERSIKLIHRFHQTDISDIDNAWSNFPETFDFSFKYSVAHMYSSPNPPFANKMLATLPQEKRVWLTIRNDDIYSFRWCSPDYARAFVLAMPSAEKLAGFYMGPDGYIWGREFIATKPASPRQLVIDKQKLSFMAWGRLSYEPNLPNSLFEQKCVAMCVKDAGATLFHALDVASLVIPLATRFFWGGSGNDFEWFPEACIHRPGGTDGFYTVMDFVNGHSMPGSGIVNITEYVNCTINGLQIQGISPLEVSSDLAALSSKALGLLERLRPPSTDETRFTTGDITAMAHLGSYYAAKILAATHLAFYLGIGDSAAKQAAIANLQLASNHWKSYADAYSNQYTPQILTRIGNVNIPDLWEAVKADILIAQNATYSSQ